MSFAKASLVAIAFVVGAVLGGPYLGGGLAFGVALFAPSKAPAEADD